LAGAVDGGSTGPLAINVVDEGPSAAVLALSGELDLSTCDELSEEIGRLERRGLERIVVDLGDLRFVDSTGMVCLLRFAERARDTDTELRFAPPSERVREIFDIAGLTSFLPFDG
jgi:anti-sigma B factor antagonist